MVQSLLHEGRRQEALRSLDRMAEVFERELGVEPGDEASALRRKIEALPVEPALVAGRGRPPLPAPRSRLVGRAADLEGLPTCCTVIAW